MRRSVGLAAAMGVVVAGLVLLPESESLGQCSKSCPQEKRDPATGCCPTAPTAPSATPSARTSKPAPSAAPSAAPALKCPAGTVLVPGGAYALLESQKPALVRPFCLDLTEVTVDAYTDCVKEGKCSTTDLSDLTYNGLPSANPVCSYGAAGRGNHPINCVNWPQAATYCDENGGRLPREEEWEWAARGGSLGTNYPWGSAAPADQLCWSGIAKRKGTCPVASFPNGGSPLGIHDLGGNVWEWTSTRHDVDSMDRVLRGGGWYHGEASIMRASHRGGFPPTDRNKDAGFRCVRGPT